MQSIRKMSKNFFSWISGLLTYGLEMVEWEAIDLHVHVN